MKLSEDQSKKAISKLSTYSTKCSLCNNTKLTLNDTIFEIREFNNGSLVLGGNSTIFPVIALTCNTCGHTQFLNAILMGLIDKES